MAGTFPQAWQEVAKIVITRLGGTSYEFNAVTDDLDLPEGDYPGESIPNLAGGRIWKQSPQEDGEVSMTIYGTNLDTTAAQGLIQEWTGISGGGAYDTSQPLATDISWPVGVSRLRDRFMVVIMWTDDDTINTAAEVLDPSGATGTNKVAMRFYAKECRIIVHKASFTDKILKMNVTFKYPAMNKAGDTKTHGWESSNDVGAVPLSALTYSAGL